MFLKRSLVLMVGVLLFIGFFLLKFHRTDAQIEDIFHQQRVAYGVDGTPLTGPDSSSTPAAPAATSPASADSASTPGAAPTPPAPPSPSPSTDNATPSPGSAPDTNTIIGPVPPPGMTPDSSPSPSAPMAPEPSPAPAPAPSPAPDSNGGPMTPPAAPAPSTINSPRETDSPFQFAAYHPGQAAVEVTEVVPTPTAPSTNPAPATATNATPTVPATNTPGPVSETNAPASAKTASTNAAPQHAVSVGGRAIVLGFHQFTGPGVPSRNIYSMSQDVFAGEMKYLHDNGYTVVPLSDVVRFVKHEIGLPPNAVAITIDDGYKSSINYAAPVLKQYGYPWTFFVYPAFITRTEGRGAASWPDLVELQKEGVDIECHSMTHPQLSHHRQYFTETPSPDGGKPIIKYIRTLHELTPAEYDDFLTNETFGAKAILEKELGKTIKYFAYPYGDYNKIVEAKVVAAGFEAIFTVADNPVHITTDIHSIGRYVITKPVERAFAGYLHQGALSLAEVDPAPGATTSNPRPVISAVLGFIGDPKSLETEVRDYGVVRHDFDPQTSTVRIYLPRDLIQSEVLVSIRDKDEQSGQVMVANWHFNYEPATGAAIPAHEPIPLTGESKGETSETNAPPAVSTLAPLSKEETNSPAHAATNTAP